jgi:hypothetical protein
MNFTQCRKSGQKVRRTGPSHPLIKEPSYNTTEIQTRKRTIEIKIYFAPALENCEDYNESEKTSTRLDGMHTFVTDLVPSEIACFDNSPGRIRRTAV